jgi:hypothetical protein
VAEVLTEELGDCEVLLLLLTAPLLLGLLLALELLLLRALLLSLLLLLREGQLLGLPLGELLALVQAELLLLPLSASLLALGEELWLSKALALTWEALRAAERLSQAEGLPALDTEALLELLLLRHREAQAELLLLPLLL